MQKRSTVRRLRQSLVTQLTLRVLLLSLITITTLVGVAVSSAFAIMVTAHREVRDASVENARTLDVFFAQITSGMTVLADTLAVGENPSLLMRDALLRFPAVYRLTYVKRNGDVLAERQRVGRRDVTRYEAQPWLNELQKLNPYWTKVDTAEFGVPFITYVVGVRDETGLIGSLLVGIDLTSLWDNIAATRVSTTGYAYLVDDVGKLLAYRDTTLAANQPQIRNLIGRTPTQVVQGSDNLMTSVYVGLNREWVVSSGKRFSELRWVVVVEEPLVEALRPFTLPFLALITALVVTLVLVVWIVRFTRVRIAHPLLALQKGVQAFREGNLDTQIALERQRYDEINTLTTTFNQMSRQLRELIGNLEQRVSDRTRDLRLAAEVSKEVTTVLKIEELLPRLVERTRQTFQFYAVSVFVYTKEGQLLRLEAISTEEPNALRHTLEFSLHDQHGLVVQAGQTRTLTLVNDVNLLKNYIAEPTLPHTRAELALPMLVGDELVGVLDVQAREVNRFTDDITRTLTALSEQFAIAVQNAHLYAQQIAVAEELRRLDKIKSHFFASVSHELRTPLNAIINFTEYVQTELLGPLTEGQKEALANVSGSGQHLLSLINDILDMTKIQAGMMQLFIETDIDLHEELATVLATAEQLVREKPDVEFVRDIAPDLPKMSGDKRRIRQILLNLLANAIKFTEQGSVTLRILPVEDKIRFVIQDTGVGIPEADQARIFQPFQQTEAGIKQGSGTGLGLPITQNLIQAHGGVLTLTSEPNKGTTFEVLLPIKVQEPAPTPLAD